MSLLFNAITRTIERVVNSICAQDQLSSTFYIELSPIFAGLTT
jgi:hypothetical protein